MLRRYFPVFLLVAALLPRAFLLLRFRSVLIDSDEAVVGLMARHIYAGEFPIFYWGQHHQGTAEAFVAALLFLLIGATPLALKLSALLWFFAFVAVHYRLALCVADRRTACAATILVAVSPSFLTIWSMKSRGGYMALLLLGTVALLLASRLLDSGYNRRTAALLGIVLGLAWWSHFLAILYIVPVVAMLLLKDERGLFRSGGAVSLTAGFLLGSLPVWIYNLAHHWASFAPGNLVQPTGFVADQRAFFRTAIPMLLGWRRNWDRDELFWFAGPVAMILVFACFTVLSVRWFRKIRPEQFTGRHLLLVFGVSCPVLFSCSGLAWFVAEPRYLLPVYSCLFILLLLLPTREKARLALFGLLLATNLLGSFRVSVQEFVGYRNPESDSELIAYLNKNKIDRLFAPYWVAYRLTFESGEEIVCTPFGGETVRNQVYERMVRTSGRAACVLLESAGSVEQKEPGKLLRKIGNYEVYAAGSIH